MAAAVNAVALDEAPIPEQVAVTGKQTVDPYNVNSFSLFCLPSRNCTNSCARCLEKSARMVS